MINLKIIKTLLIYPKILDLCKKSIFYPTKLDFIHKVSILSDKSRPKFFFQNKTIEV